MRALSLLISFVAVLFLTFGSYEARPESTGQVPLTVPARLPQLPLIGDPAPEFEAETTQGPIHFPDDYKGKWVILFSHPGDFTPVCTSEFVIFGSMAHEFAKLNTELLGLSLDDVDSHNRWKKSIREKIEYQGIKNLEIPFAIIGDADQEIAWRYGMLHPRASDKRTVRAVFFIDPEGTIRAMLYYPHEIGRNISEIKRMLIAMQTSDAYKVATPANWNPGEDVLVPLAGKGEGDSKCQESYFCMRELDKSKIELP
jgi:peroxiredoxin 2/4